MNFHDTIADILLYHHRPEMFYKGKEEKLLNIDQSQSKSMPFFTDVHFFGEK